MKKISTSLVLFLLFSFLSFDTLAQTFNTGAIGVALSNGGRTRILSTGTTRQIDRISVLIAATPTQVFDYDQDQDSLFKAYSIPTPLFSDFEAVMGLDNTYSDLPPNVEVLLDHFGWSNGGYILIKAYVKNKEAAAINAVFGMEVIPQVDNAYGSEIIEWDAVSHSVLIHKTNWVGIKFFSTPQTNLTSFRWFDGYPADTSYYKWLTKNTFDLVHNADPVDGAVAVFGVGEVTIPAGGEHFYYYGVSLGTDKASCLANLSLAEMRYNNFVPVELTSFTAFTAGNKVQLSWSTATEVNNRGFEIERSINKSEWSLIGFKEGAGTISDPQTYAYVDNLNGITAQKIYYRLKQIDFDGTSAYSDAVEVENRMAPDQFVLEQNYPNPFNPSTKISFGLPEKSNVMLKVFNLIGEEVALITSGVYEAGTYSFNFDASELPTGIYMYVLQTESNVISRKMTLLK